MIIGIIGCGNMGAVIARGIVKTNDAYRERILLYDKEIDKAESLASETGAEQAELAELVGESDILIVAVKPQDAESLFGEISGSRDSSTRPSALLRMTTVIVSIMAGVKMEVIAGMVEKDVPIIRAMPNMGAFVGEGMTCLARNGLVASIEEVKGIFAGIGEVVEVEESVMDAVTAVSGSGPAYLFYLAEAMIKAAVKAGLAGDVAEKLVRQTLYGASLVLKSGKDSPEELIKKVASKGGTTEAALSVFDEKDLRSIIETAVQKAKKRSEELSRR